MRLVYILVKNTVILAILGILMLNSFAVSAQNQKVIEIVAVSELSVLSEPESDAEVYLDGKFVGHTPFLKKIEVGFHELTIKKDMYYDYHDTIKVLNTKVDVKAKLSPKFGMLKINTKPMGAKVLFNGIEYPSTTPCISGKIYAGELNVSLKLENHKKVDTTVMIEEGKITNLSLQLEKQPRYQFMTKEDYDYQLNKTYKTNEDNTIVTTDTVNTDEVLEESVVVKPKKIRRYSTPRRKIEKENSIWAKGGLGLSHVRGIGDDGKKIDWSNGNYYSVYPTFYFGAQYSYRLNVVFAISVDLNFSRTGYQYTFIDKEFSYGVINKFIFNGIELPIAARAYFLTDGVGPYAEIGAVVNYRNKCRVDYTLSNGNQEKLKYNVNSFNYGLVGGLGWDFKIAKITCSANARAIMEASNIFNDVNYRMIYFQFGVGVRVF